MANEFGGEHRLQSMRIDFKTSLLSKRIGCRPRLYRLLHPNDAIGLDRIAIERYQAQMLDPLKQICRVGYVNVTGVTRDYAAELKTAMEADEPLVLESPQVAEMCNSKAKGRARKRKRQSNYYKYHKG
ncbi:MAG: hypothetical protein M1836_000478 [Candelina mexicana]|nr:MAG: hypothetical protein M1836_000478 [Candelina mexicana]